jgi:transporter family-2 protein
MHSSAMLIAALTGALLTAQIGCNAMVGSRLGHPLWGSLANFAVGSAVLVAVTLALGLRWPAAAAIAGVPAWAWIGGLFGATYIVSSTAIGPLIGGATFLALTVAGQMLSALLIDHYGWLGFPVREISLLRFTGALLVVAGVVLLARG